MSLGGWFDTMPAKDRLNRLVARADADRAAGTAGKPARRSARSLARTLRTHWWPRFLVAGVLLVAVGTALLSGAAEAWVVGAGAAIVFVVISKWLSMSAADYGREPPMPPGAPPPGGGA